MNCCVSLNVKFVPLLVNVGDGVPLWLKKFEKALLQAVESRHATNSKCYVGSTTFVYVTNMYGTIIRTGIKCKKILVICTTQLAGSLLLERLKYLEVMLNNFEFSRVWENL